MKGVFTFAVRWKGPQSKIQKLKEPVRLGVIGAKDSSSKCLLAISKKHREQWAKPLRKVHVSNNRSNSMILKIFFCTLGWSIKLGKNWATENQSHLKSLLIEMSKRRVSL